MTSLRRPYGYGWRSSKHLFIATACVAMFTETLLYGFVVPILPYMLEVRLHADPAQTQSLTSSLLSIHGFVTLISAPFIAALVDKMANQKIPFLLSLTVCVTGTILVALTPTFWALFLGRLLQAIAGSAAWIVCLAIVTDKAGEGNVGKVMGMSMSFVMMGTVGGPVVAGILLEYRGYWSAWSVPLTILLLDIIARLIMIEPQQPSPPTVNPRLENGSSAITHNSVAAAIENTETSPLLPHHVRTAETGCQASDAPSAAPASGFYVKMLRDARILASVANTIVHSAIIAGFETTFPVHLRQVFNWGPSSVGVIFFILQVPSIFLGPVSGWLRDRFGIRYPTMVGWTLIAPLIWLLGIPGNVNYAGADDKGHGKAIFISSMTGIGIFMPLILGAGFIHTITVLQDIESKQPNIFGANGGRSRAFAMNSVGFNLGLMFGPLLSTFLSEAIGYYYMNLPSAWSWQVFRSAFSIRNTRREIEIPQNKSLASSERQPWVLEWPQHAQYVADH
ncbi:hypothetical protein VE03_06297 [Pseudogymnoascus sp. 23342-1-I1]|nr:hypothetical protein VE03_06297 [Pseudogymnoascus sp. 23342-1-I1]